MSEPTFRTVWPFYLAVTRSSRRAARARVAASLARLAAAAGMPCPPVRVRGRTGAYASRRRDGTRGVTVSRRRAYGPGLNLEGVLAHELSHIAYGEPPERTRAQTALAIAVIVPALLAIAATGITLTLRASLLDGLLAGPWTPSLAVLGSLILIALLIVPLRILLRCERRWRTAHRYVSEVRADLNASRLASPAATLAALRSLGGSRGPRWWRAFQRLNERANIALLPTHPPTALRITIVQEYDGVTDPDQAARHALTAHGALTPRQAGITLVRGGNPRP